MPEKEVVKRAEEDARQGKSPSTQAGEFVHEEIEHVRQGKHGARSTKQAIAIGLSKARRAGVKLPPPKAGSVPEETRQQANRESAQAHGASEHHVSPTRSRASTVALQHEGSEAATHEALSHHAHSSAMQRDVADRKRAARKAARTRTAGHE